MADVITATVPCFHYDSGCSYRLPLVEERPSLDDGQFVNLQVDWLAARIHHRYAHGEELEVQR